MEVVVYTDGSCDQVRECGCGAHILTDNEEITLGKYIGRGTNNQAEYGALIMALDWLDREGFHNANIKMYCDAQLIVKQVTGLWCVNNIPLMELNQQVLVLMKRFDSISLNWVPRHKNKQADKISRQYGYMSEEFDLKEVRKPIAKLPNCV